VRVPDAAVSLAGIRNFIDILVHDEFDSVSGVPQLISGYFQKDFWSFFQVLFRVLRQRFKADLQAAAIFYSLSQTFLLFVVQTC
jgi:hypothetical protein